MDSRRDYWEKHYAAVAQHGTPWLDYSNERVQLQSLGLALAASGNVIGVTCLDAGCGRGQLACALADFGASAVVAFDMVESLVAENRKNRPRPDIRWECLNLNDTPTIEALGTFDRVYAMEVLQYVPVRQTVEFLYTRLSPGGRIIAMIPNADCPIVQNSFARFEGQYVGASVADLAEVASGLPELETWACRGLSFTADQRIAPYESSRFTQSSADWQSPPNRLLWVALRRPIPESPAR
jgi:2-polyprenyl-3-methyl-5-hydroxy-6-metoxy-1,4-benzoquinol methylase